MSIVSLVIAPHIRVSPPAHGALEEDTSLESVVFSNNDSEKEDVGSTYIY